MQVSSIGNTNFGLTIHPSLQDILDRSKIEVAKQGRTELDMWRRNVKALTKIGPDDYTIFVEDRSDLQTSKSKYAKPYEVKIEYPLGLTAGPVYSFDKGDILDRTAIKEINNKIRKNGCFPKNKARRAGTV